MWGGSGGLLACGVVVGGVVVVGVVVKVPPAKPTKSTVPCQLAALNSPACPLSVCLPSLAWSLPVWGSWWGCRGGLLACGGSGGGMCGRWSLSVGGVWGGCGVVVVVVKSCPLSVCLPSLAWSLPVGTVGGVVVVVFWPVGAVGGGGVCGGCLLACGGVWGSGGGGG